MAYFRKVYNWSWIQYIELEAPFFEVFVLGFFFLPLNIDMTYPSNKIHICGYNQTHYCKLHQIS